VKRREAVLAMIAAALVVLALLTVFASELSNTQAKSKRDVQTRVHERAVLAAALIDSLFQSVEQQIPQDVRTYGSPTVTAQTMDRNRQRNAYLVLLDSSGAILAHSRGFTPQARADLAGSAALRLVRAGHRYGLGNVLPYGKTGVINFAVVFPTKFGLRTLLTGFTSSALSTFIAGELSKIPGVKGAHNYLIDGNNTVLGSTNPAIPTGHVFSAPSQIHALSHSSGDVKAHYYDQVQLTNSTWRMLLVAPNGPLFATVTGLRKWLPWLIFIAFALVAMLTLLLARRVLRSAAQVREANSRLASVNAELASTNDALEHRAAELARSNGELEQFASIASHDLQEPLRKIRTFTQQLNVAESDRLSDKGHDYLERTNSAAQRMQKLIEDLLRFSRVATHGRPFGPVDLTEVTNEVLGDLEAQVKRTGAVLHVGDLPTISGDELQMRQLLQNLISNALKFHRAGVRPEIAIEAEVADGTARLTVSDNGIGFEPKYGPRIFRVFERLHGRSEYPGTGIGLALCRKIADRHGGSIFAESEPGVGSTFTVTLPLHQREEILDAPVHTNGDGATPREETYVPA
jgi:signal transduction histidine kinase